MACRALVESKPAIPDSLPRRTSHSLGIGKRTEPDQRETMAVDQAMQKEAFSARSLSIAPSTHH